VSFFRIPSPKPSGGAERAKKGRTSILGIEAAKTATRRRQKGTRRGLDLAQDNKDGTEGCSV
jgi:hypothetical protein